MPANGDGGAGADALSAADARRAPTFRTGTVLCSTTARRGAVTVGVMCAMFMSPKRRFCSDGAGGTGAGICRDGTFLAAFIAGGGAIATGGDNVGAVV
jgi:hypothetical protein